MKIYKTILIAIPLIISTNVYASTGMFGTTRYAQTNMGALSVCIKLPGTKKSPKYGLLRNTRPIPCYFVTDSDNIDINKINTEFLSMGLKATLDKKKQSTLTLTANLTFDSKLGYRQWGLQESYVGRIDAIYLPQLVAPDQKGGNVRMKLYCKNKWIVSNQDDYTCGSNI